MDEIEHQVRVSYGLEEETENQTIAEETKE